MKENIFKRGWDKFISFFKNANSTNLYALDGCVPFHKGFVFGIQHILAMFIGNMAPILILLQSVVPDGSDKATLLQNTIFIAALGTLLQLYPLWRFGGKLPLIIGSSFTQLGMSVYIGATYGYGAMVGAFIVGGLFIAILGLFAKYWYKFIKPIVSSVVVLALGLSLLSVGADYFAGGSTTTSSVFSYCSWQSLMLGAITLISCLLFQILVKGVWKNLSTVFGIVVGYIVALCMGGIDFSAFNNLQVFALPKFYDFSKIQFNIWAIIPACLICFVATAECFGGCEATCVEGLNRQATNKEIAGTISGVGLTTAISAVFGCVPATVYGQNIGIISSSKVVNRYSILLGVLVLFIASLFPPVATFLLTIPTPVLGGVLIMILSSIMVTGMKMVSSCGFTPKNIIIISISLGIGFGFSLISGIYSSLGDIASNLLSSPVVMTFILALILSFAIPEKYNSSN